MKNRSLVIVAAAALSALLASPSARAESTGVPECDSYLRQMEQCVTARVPEPEKSEFLKGASLARVQFRRMTTMPYKPDVAGACREAQTTTFAMLSRQYGCRFTP